ncbi:MAG: hypothetical protein KatS3mg105_4159 [Gemmatales bacterium]|nr:MAG: hypothetical protein KatS3mg105_4159 [Gemmatales bacterium]
MEQKQEHGEEGVELPAPTAWPIVLALAVTLILGGVITNYAFTITGVVLGLVAGFGWARHVYVPAVGHELVPFVPPEQRPRPIKEVPGAVRHMRPGLPGHRLRFPEKMRPYSAGAKGGLIGGIAMTIPAFLYGLIGEGSIWFPVNLLAELFIPTGERSPEEVVAALRQFHIGYLLVGLFVHIVISSGLGLIYGVILPMLPANPVFWGGLVAPLLWTGALHATMGLLDPQLQDLIYWPAFVASQVVFGLVVGVVVVRTEEVYVKQ